MSGVPYNFRLTYYFTAQFSIETAFLLNFSSASFADIITQFHANIGILPGYSDVESNKQILKKKCVNIEKRSSITIITKLLVTEKRHALWRSKKPSIRVERGRWINVARVCPALLRSRSVSVRCVQQERAWIHVQKAARQRVCTIKWFWPESRRRRIITVHAPFSNIKRIPVVH